MTIFIKLDGLVQGEGDYEIIPLEKLKHLLGN